VVEVEERLRLELGQIAPLNDDGRDWQDVLARVRASGPPRAQTTTRRRRIVGFAIAAFLLATGAAVAVELIGRENVPFGSSAPAPNIVKKQFADLAIGAPPQMTPGVLAAQARQVGTFTVAGHVRKLWVAPTRHGGYCYTFEHAFGGCRRDSQDRTTARLGVTWTERSPEGAVPIATQVGGDITDPAAYRLTLDYADGTRRTLSFVWVSRPIKAGFFVYGIPQAHQQRTTRLVKIVLRSRTGKQLAVQEFKPRPQRHTVPHVLPSAPSAPSALPARPTIPPTTPLQRGEARGVTVAVGANGSALFDLTRLDPTLRPLLTRGGIGYTCYRLTREFGIFTVRSLSIRGKLAPMVGTSYHGIGTPFDGCELQGEYGHRWPDRFDSHTAVEIPFTAKGRAFVMDRAAARDLALFVRSREMHTLRKLEGQRLLDALQATFGRALANSRIHVTPTADGAVFSERSATGKMFTVVIRGGRIVKQNLKPYAFVF
jgi:hypothetical protein